MSEAAASKVSGAGTSHAHRHGALFTGLVLQQTNMALMFLGKTPRPDASQPAVDLEAASMFIDTLEMLEVKTRGNLGAEEASLLRETLTSLRIAFVEAADAAPKAGSEPQKAGAAPPPSEAPGSGSTRAESDTGPSAEGDGRKKYVKRY